MALWIGAPAVAGVALAACRPLPPRAAAQTWIDHAPTAFLSSDDLQTVDCAVHFEPADGELAAGLDLVRGARLAGVGGGTSVRGGDSSPMLRIGRRLAAGSFDSVRLVMTGLRRGKVRLEGTPEDGEPWRLELDKTEGTGALRDHYLFRVPAGLVAGVTRELRLEPTTAAGEIVSLRELCVGRQRIDDGRVAAAATLPWKVTLADETRDSLLLSAGHPLLRSFEIAKPVRLGFAVGALELGAASTLAVSVREPDGMWRELWRDGLAADQIAGRWREVDVGLGELGWGKRELRLSVESAASQDGKVVLAVAHPRIYGARGRASRPNIVLVSLDTLRADHLPLYGYPRPTSPGLDAWAREAATVFGRVVAPSGWTLPSHFSLFTGLDAFRHPANYNSIAIDESAYPTLAERLWQAGYRTHAITAGGFVHPDYGLARGFESFLYWPRRETAAAELAAHAKAAATFLDQQPERPFFLFFHTYEIHAPNPLRAPFLPAPERFPPGASIASSVNPTGPEEGFLGTHHLDLQTAEGERRPLPRADYDLAVDAYDSAIAYTDAQLSPLLRQLSSQRFRHDTIVAIVSDHGESLGENDHGGHGSLQADNLFVPMIVRLPAMRSTRSVESQVRLIDLFPTLLEAAGVEVPPRIDGESMGSALAGGSVAPREAWSYAASTNFGMALLRADGLKMEWRNSPWRALSGGIRWLRVRDSSEEPVAPPADADADLLPDRARRAYADGIPGLRISVTDRGARPVEVTLSSDFIDPVGVKTPDLGRPSLDWVDIGRLDAVVHPQQPLRLVIERLLRREIALRLSAAADGCSTPVSRTIEVDAAALAKGRAWQLDLPGCAGGSRTLVELRLEWHGPLPEHAIQAEGELADDLRALGYLQ